MVDQPAHPKSSAKRDIDAMSSMSLHDKASKLPFLPAYKARCNNGSSLAVSLMADAFSVWHLREQPVSAELSTYIASEIIR